MNEAFINFATDFIQSKLRIQESNKKYQHLKKRVEGIVYYLQTGCSLRWLPSHYGSKSIISYWLRKLSREEVFEKLWQDLVNYAHQNGQIDISNQSIDCSIVKAPGGGEKTRCNPFDKYKYGTKRSIAVDGRGLPIGCSVGSATRHDSRLLHSTILSIPGNIRTKPATMHLDKAYDSKFCETALFNYYYKPNIARRKNRKNVSRKKSKHRWKVERTFSWINRFAGTFFRWSRYVSTYFQMLCLSFAIIIWRKL